MASRTKQTIASQLIENINTKNITIGVVGLGYVGLPLAVEFARKGIRTIGFDVDASKITSLQKGKNYIQDIKDEHVREVWKNKTFTATTDFSESGQCDIIYICVPTPFTDNKDPDISYIVESAKAVAASMRKGQLIILKSTTFPGTTRKYVKPITDATKLVCGKDYFLAFSPERIDPGNKTWHTGNTPIVVGGISPDCTRLAVAVNELIIEKVIPVSTPEVAEMEKLLENIFRSVNIALVNELAQLCDRIGVNIWEVVESAATKPFGFMPFFPGPGIGGHCILIDPYYLSWMAREFDFVTNFIELAAEVNESMPFYVRSMIEREIAKQPVTMQKAKVLMLGMAFKKDVDDLRHSPALKVAELLDDDGITNISYFDPFIPSVELHHGKSKKRMLKSIKSIDAASLKKYDVVCITTDHSSFDYASIVKNSKVVVDTRNACKKVKGAKKNVVLLGDGK
ncbi:MAG: nucleotide sugar dehydrogenase [Candidatus Kapabacteria bacterium]|nr:nucleotide sugar dehydrogenase [Candidatus Kapabacteria bacterium]